MRNGIDVNPIGVATYRRYWLWLYRRDVVAAARIVEEAMEVWTPQRVYQRLFEPALGMSVGLRFSGKIQERDEHFIIWHTQQFMRRVRHRFPPPDSNGPLAIVTSAGQISHQIGLQIVCDFLRWAGWRIHWLSSNDRGMVGEVVERLQPQAILLSIGQDSGLTTAARLIQEVRKRRGFAGPIAVGGRAINVDPSRVAQIGADLTANTAASFVRLLRKRFPRSGFRKTADACDLEVEQVA